MTYEPRPMYLLTPVRNTPELEEVINTFLALWLERHRPSDSAPLYHYTTLAGMKGILSDRALWFGHVSSFNDPNELQYGQALAEEVLSRSINLEQSHEVRGFLKALLTYVQAFGKRLYHMFVACFCESDKLLSQWRAYADGGGGYCLGFRFSPSTRISSDVTKVDDVKPPFLRRVIYADEEQRLLLTRYVDSVTGAAKKALGSENTHRSIIEAMMAQQAVNVLFDMLISFKHPAFQDEKEWRMVRATSESHQPEHVQFRGTGGALVAYRPTHIFDQAPSNRPQFPLSSITLGPSLELARTRPAIELLLHHTAADGNAIELNPNGVSIGEAGFSLR